jgi:hypothetical protein
MFHRHNKQEPTRSYADVEEGGRKYHGKKSRNVRRTILFIPCYLVFTFVILRIAFPESMNWTWANRYYYVGCPESAIWLRRPFDSWTGGRTRPRTLLLTAKFATDTRFYEQLQTHRRKLINTKVLDPSDILTYMQFPDFILDDPTWIEHLEFRHHGENHIGGRGAGFWFWKAVLIHKHLSELSDGDFIIYSDADAVDHMSWTPLLLETMVDRDLNFAIYEMHWLEREWTKRDVYEKYCPTVDPEKDESVQYSAMWMIVRKSNRTLQLISDWLETTKDYHDLNDEPSDLDNIAGFHEHRHDQSLLSLLLKCRYNEPQKQAFTWTCLGNWGIQMFRI